MFNKIKNKILLLTAILFIIININVVAFEKYDSKTYELKTQITVKGDYTPDSIRPNHYMQYNFDSPNFKLLGFVTDKDINPYKFEFDIVRLIYSYNDKNIFTNKRIIEVSKVKYDEKTEYNKVAMEKENEKYLNASQYIDNTLERDRIKELSSEILKGETDIYKKAKLIYAYVNTQIHYDLEYGNRGWRSALYYKKGVCEDISELLTVLYRANDIPARMCYGFRINPNTVTNEYTQIDNKGHAWVEAFILGEWITIDATTYIDSKDTNRDVYWGTFYNDVGDHVLISYDKWENFGVGLSKGAIYEGYEVNYYIKLAE